MIKTLIYIDVFLIMVSLASGLYFLIVDQGKTDSKRTVYSLGFRVTFPGLNFCDFISKICICFKMT